MIIEEFSKYYDLRYDLYKKYSPPSDIYKKYKMDEVSLHGTSTPVRDTVKISNEGRKRLLLSK